MFCSFLALVLKKALEDRIAPLGRSSSWPQIIADLDSLTETEIAYDGKRARLHRIRHDFSDGLTEQAPLHDRREVANASHLLALPHLRVGGAQSLRNVD